MGQRFTIGVALLFMGAARIAAVGPWHLTFTAAEAVEAARAFSDSWIVPLNFEGREHLSQSRVEVEELYGIDAARQSLGYVPRHGVLEFLRANAA